MSIAPYPTSSVLSRSLVSIGTLVASVVIGISASGRDYLPPAIPALVGLCAVAGLFAGIAPLKAARRTPTPHSAAGPVLLIAGSVVIIGWACHLFLSALGR